MTHRAWHRIGILALFSMVHGDLVDENAFALKQASIHSARRDIGSVRSGKHVKRRFELGHCVLLPKLLNHQRSLFTIDSTLMDEQLLLPRLTTIHGDLSITSVDCC